MTKKIFAKYDKKLIPQLPRVVFPGRIIVILTPGEAERAVDFLLSHPLLGIDTETRPSFKRGTLHKVALLQVATEEICFLFRLLPSSASWKTRRWPRWDCRSTMICTCCTNSAISRPVPSSTSRIA